MRTEAGVLPAEEMAWLCAGLPMEVFLCVLDGVTLDLDGDLYGDLDGDLDGDLAGILFGRSTEGGKGYVRLTWTPLGHHSIGVNSGAVTMRTYITLLGTHEIAENP